MLSSHNGTMETNSLKLVYDSGPQLLQEASIPNDASVQDEKEADHTELCGYLLAYYLVLRRLELL